MSKIFNTIRCQLSHWKNKNEFDKLRNETGDYSLVGFDRLKCIYVHIPKAAGISINKALFGNYGGGHRTVREYKRIFGPKLFNQYYTFTFVRNPYSRLFSAYRFLKKGGFNRNNRDWAKINLNIYSSFDEFVRNWINESNIWSYIHFKPQYSFVCDLGYIPEIDFIGKVESINKDFETVCKALNIQNNLSVYNKSNTDNTDWEQFYTDYTFKKVSDIYQHDFEIFDYQYEI